MQTRRFGRTGHQSTVAIFGAFAISQGTQEQANAIMELVIKSGVNHIDIAPSYGISEERLSPWMILSKLMVWLLKKYFIPQRNGRHART